MSLDVSVLTEDEMKNLHFGKLSAESKGYLIPIWLYTFLRDDVKSKMNNDHRGGYLAYSVMPKSSRLTSVELNTTGAQQDHSESGVG